MRYALDTKPTVYYPIRSVWTRREDAENPIEPDAYLDYNDSFYNCYRDESWTDENGVGMKSTYFTKGFTTKKNMDDMITTDWRELIYQMALDYNALGSEDDFFLRVAAANPQYPTGKTGYE
jgi:hypothetical protein